MARPIRLEFSGALYHVTSRGDGREAIYLSDADRQDWLAVLGQVCKRFNWEVHAWCQMSNHYHLLLETPEGNLSAGMRQLNGVYTQNFNRRHARVGHVFQGRYKAILVERDAYLLELARYIVLNPVRAGMVAQAQDWPWSSCLAMLGQAPAPDWLNVGKLLMAFAELPELAAIRYLKFVEEGLGRPSVWGDLKGQVYLGSDAFLNTLKANIEKSPSAEHPRMQRRAMGKALKEYVAQACDKPSRNAAICAAYASGDYTQQELATAFGLHYTSISRIVVEA
ncbi:transposase [Uliginosibacterium sp. 31-12]|uniref:REP-associated tyrosine transposase n=1 Tax=Uliginosibacterium sp. 31-12 TaxID=3062781 RepID=UPI0026E2EB66|nr:transposase [Uliginosibacterium sp. 31-12]MDO6387008.1 transposase [Uliginosibacterium sp. 31-12]